jgi:hypothetical protein
MAPAPYAPEDVWGAFNDPANALSGEKKPDKFQIIALQRYLLDAVDAFADATGVDPSGLRNEIAARILGDNASAPAQFGFRGPTLYDRDGAAGGGGACYLPAQFYLNRADLPQGFLSVTLTPASNEVPGYVRVPLPSAETDVVTVYVDLGILANNQTNALQVVTSQGSVNDALKGNFFPVFRAWSGGYWSLYECYELTDSEETAFWFPTPMALQRFPDATGNAALLVPSFYAFRRDMGFVGVLPANGDMFTEFLIDVTGTQANRLYLDWLAVKRGVQPYVKQAVGGNLPNDGYMTPVFARNIGGQVQSEHPVADLTIPGKIGANQLAVNALFSAAPTRFGTLSFVPTTDAFLTGLALTQGWKGASPAAGDVSAFIGASCDPDINPIAYFFARIYVQVSADNDFYNTGSSTDERGSFYVYGSDGNAYLFPMFFEKRCSARVASFIVRGRFFLPGFKPVSWLIGGRDKTGKGWVWTGAQVSFSNDPVNWISRTDYAGIGSKEANRQALARFGAQIAQPADFVFPAKLFLTAGRPIAMFPANGLPDPLGRDAFIFDLASANGTANPPVMEIGDRMQLDPDKLGASLELTFHSRTGVGSAYRETMSVVRAPATSTATVTLLIFGDSLTNRDTIAYAVALLRARGMTVNMVGTQNNGGVRGEGREGWGAEDFTYANTRFPPLATGQEGAYNAMSYDQKNAVNPFIRVATSSDSPADVRNGYIVDLDFYLNRGLDLGSTATPTHTPIGLGTNDQLHAAAQSAALATAFTANIGTLYSRIRAKLPNAKVGMLAHRQGYPVQFGRWPNYHAYILKSIDIFTRRTDIAVDFVGAYLFHSPWAGWAYSVNGTDADGTDDIALPDDIHYLEPNKRATAEAWAAWVGATADAVSYVATSSTGSGVYIGVTDLSVARTIPLPPAASFKRGQTVTVADETGNCSDTRRITVSVSGSDAIGTQTSFDISSPYLGVSFRSNGANLWTLA